MAKNYIKPGDHITFTAGANLNSGQGVVIGALLGVALTTLASGDSGEAAVEGVWELPKATAAVIGNGAKLIWDVTNNNFKVSSAATGDLNGCAVAVEAAGNGVTTVKAKLAPGAATIT